MGAAIEAQMDVNKFYELARHDLASLIGGAGVHSAVIFNDSGHDVTFNVYNYVDILYAIPAQTTRVASSFCGRVAASGVEIKVHPNGDRNSEFLVRPGKAYVYFGPGKVKEV